MHRVTATALHLACLLLLGLAATAPQSARAAPSVVVTDHGEKTDELPDHRRVTRTIAVAAGDFMCELLFRNTDYLDAEGNTIRSEGNAGVHFWSGQGQGWYPIPTFQLYADGALLNSGGVVRDTRVLEQGDSALVETTLAHPRATLRLRFAYRPGQEGLDVQCLLLPPPDGAPPVGELSVSLSCYPAFYTAWNKRRGHRLVVTPTRSIEEPREEGLDMDARAWERQIREETLDLAQEDWLFCYDRRFNSPDGEGRGMCGLVFMPESLQQAQVSVTDYEIAVRLAGRPGGPALEFTLWQTRERDYAPEVQRFPEIVPACRERLQDPALFLPQSLVGFDAAAEAGALRPLAELPGHGELVAQLRALEQVLRRLRAAPPSVAEEEAALGRLMDYRRAVWQAGRALPRPRRVLVLQGAHYPTWRLAEAGESSGELQFDESFFSTSWRGDRLTAFPATEAEMLQYDAVVFLNVSAVPLRESGEALLREFVAHGGGLLVLGGFYAYGGGRYHESVLAELLPVTGAAPFDVKRLPAPASLAPGVRVPGLPALPGGDQSVVLWLHDLQPRPEAQVPLYADLGAGQRAPFLVVGGYGEGRVAACLGTVYGEAPPGKTEFWNHPGWPAWLAALTRWVCGQDTP